MNDIDTMVGNPADFETEEEQRRKRLAAMMPAALDAARGGAMPTREASDSGSRGFLQRALTSAQSQAGGAANAPEVPSRNVMPPAGAAPQPRSDAFPAAPLSQPDAAGWRHAVHPGEDAAKSHPLMPPVKALTPPVAPDLGAPSMPPVGFPPKSLPMPTGVESHGETLPLPTGARPKAEPLATMPPVMPATPTAIPPAGRAAMAAPPDSANVMPPVKFDTTGLQPHDIQPAPIPTKPLFTGSSQDRQGMPPVQVGPQMKAYEDLAAKGAPNPKWWQRALEIAGSLSPFGRAIEEQIPSTPLGYNAKLNQAALRAAKEQMLGKGEQEHETAAAQAQFNTPEKRRAFVKANPDLLEGADKFQINNWVATGNKFPTKEPIPKTERPENLDREAYDDYVSRGMSPADARKRVLQDAQSVKPERQTHTSPFEAFAYGDPGEKKAAQDFLDMEKRLGSRYRTPSEFEEKYRLFKEDPETYKAMFGDKDKAGTPDPATATRMLNYFDRRRREVNGDFTLDETQKQEQLRDIENLEKPFMDAVQPGAGGDRVNVIGPDGTPGTIPRKQLEKAKQKGYREAPTR